MSAIDVAVQVDQRHPARTLDLSAVIKGRRVDIGHASLELTHATGTVVRMPALTADDVETLLRADGSLLAELRVQDIIAFLNRVGQNWKSPDYVRRRLYVRQLQDVLGYSEKAAEFEADWIGIILSSHGRAYDLLATDLGSRFVIDEWVAREEAVVRAFPLGNTLHLLPGNAPITGVVSLVRGLLTKNACIAKVSSGDPVTPLALALSFMDIDPEHPVSLATSVIYWPRDDTSGRTIAKAVDGICVWGEAEALRWARESARDSAEVICFGPRRSMAFVGRDADHRRAARGLAHDVSVYEQRACFSVREVFVEQPIEPFVEELRVALDEYCELLPPATRTFDELARAAFVRQEEAFLGSSVIEADDASWAMILGEPGRATEHPLGRTIYIHAVEDASEMLTWVDRTVQTVAVQPWDRLHDLRDALAMRGVSRMVELGLNNLFRVGGSHDGMQPLARLVRMVSVERPAAVHGKGMVVTNDQTELLRAGTLRSLVL